VSISGKRAFEAIIFDLGSTLVHFEGDMLEAISRSITTLTVSLNQSGLDLEWQAFKHDFLHELDKYRAERDSQFVEYTTAYILRTYLSALGYPRVPEEVVRKALVDMYAVTQEHWRVEKDAQPTLNALQERGYRLGIISNAADDADVQTLIDEANIRLYFDFIISSAALGIRKPDERIFQNALNRWRLKPQQVAMVGDTLEADILGARRADIFAIWITRRAAVSPGANLQEMIKPDATISRLEQLPSLLEEMVD
jgi:putative hydrolase of the HAD superfamily